MPLVNEDDLDWTDVDDGGMHVRRKQLGEAAGGDQLGCSLYELPAGEASWPYHYHTANEEAVYVLSGTGMLRLAGESQPLRAGDYVTFPPDESGSHRVVNDSEGTLRYLAVSTMHEPEVTVYPDSEKVGVFVGAAPGGRSGRTHNGYYRMADDVDYWDGE
ncbi:cupin domain-containing protein [Halobacterium noricense]|uniref:cupin domain-containing protein n=1 Tax=Halobacterium noricense TaxID=223182 RepID=UPI001E55E76A|nr:cupin domain-containing protein [Halobacterium noricense]UHH24244.1 cupin domain-containing protein [Halobacterium noricense]